MITKDPIKIKLLRQSGAILADVLNKVAAQVSPGVSSFDLNQLAEREIAKAGARGSFKNYQSSATDIPYPASLCVSINDEVVHGIPSKKKILKDGDIVGLDLGINYKNVFTDGAITVPVGKVDPKKLNLLAATREALYNCLEIVKPGITVGDIGHIIQTTVESQGFQPVRELVGHGVGNAVHEDPEIPCYGKPGRGPALEEGMVVAIEPMVNAGKWKILIDKDGWTIKTADHSPSAHFEHTVLVTATGCEIITKI